MRKKVSMALNRSISVPFRQVHYLDRQCTEANPRLLLHTSPRSNAVSLYSVPKPALDIMNAHTSTTIDKLQIFISHLISSHGLILMLGLRHPHRLSNPSTVSLDSPYSTSHKVPIRLPSQWQHSDSMHRAKSVDAC